MQAIKGEKSDYPSASLHFPTQPYFSQSHTASTTKLRMSDDSDHDSVAHDFVVTHQELPEIPIFYRQFNRASLGEATKCYVAEFPIAYIHSSDRPESKVGIQPIIIKSKSKLSWKLNLNSFDTKEGSVFEDMKLFTKELVARSQPDEQEIGLVCSKGSWPFGSRCARHNHKRGVDKVLQFCYWPQAHQSGQQDKCSQ